MEVGLSFGAAKSSPRGLGQSPVPTASGRGVELLRQLHPTRDRKHDGRSIGHRQRKGATWPTETEYIPQGYCRVRRLNVVPSVRVSTEPGQLHSWAGRPSGSVSSHTPKSFLSSVVPEQTVLLSREARCHG